MLCEAAHHASRPDHPLNPYFARLCARRGYKMAIVAVAHRLCRIIFAMLRHQRAISTSPSWVSNVDPSSTRSFAPTDSRRAASKQLSGCVAQTKV